MRYDAEHKQKTRERVLKEAAKAIRSQGPHRIGVARVMGRAGLTHGGFYAHFASKEALVAATIDQLFRESHRLARETQDRSPAEGLNAYIDFYLSPEHRDGRTSGCPLPFLSADVPRLPRVSRERFAAGVAKRVEELAGHLERLGRKDPQADASSMLAELLGALSLARAEPNAKRSDAIMARSRAALKRRLGLEGATQPRNTHSRGRRDVDA